MSTKKIRCSFCRKKTGLINFTCKCKGVFCSKHRYTHTHLCKGIERKKEESRVKLAVNNPKVVCTKVEKI